ncbi:MULTISPECIES: hypothetical protein [Yersinia]|nr:MULTISPECIES: hypothetical protein [Yersinia]
MTNKQKCISEMLQLTKQLNAIVASLHAKREQMLEEMTQKAA